MPQPTTSHRQRVDATAGVLLLLVAAAIVAALVVNHWSRSTNTSLQQHVLAGMSDRKILAAMERTYGSRVLAAPAFGGLGRVFWVLPWLVLAILGVAGGLLLHRGRVTQPVLEQLDEKTGPTKADRDQVNSRLQDYL